MSWSESFSNLRLGDLAALQPSNEQTRGSLEQFNAAINAAQTVIMSGSLGNPREKDCFFSIHINGHENKDHIPPPGWSPDQVSLHVTRTNNRDSE
jgi:hypothetical protein